MSAGEIIALVVAVGGCIGALVSLYGSVTQSQLKRVEHEANERQKDQESKNRTFNQQLDYLQEENARMAKSLTEARAESDRAFTQLGELRRLLNVREDELVSLRRELTAEKGRTTELEKRVNELTSERDGYLAQLQASKGA